MTTKLLDNKICIFKILLSWRSPIQTLFLGDFPLCPQCSPLTKRKCYFYCRLAVSEKGLIILRAFFRVLKNLQGVFRVFSGCFRVFFPMRFAGIPFTRLQSLNSLSMSAPQFSEAESNFGVPKSGRSKRGRSQEHANECKTLSFLSLIFFRRV